MIDCWIQVSDEKLAISFMRASRTRAPFARRSGRFLRA